MPRDLQLTDHARHTGAALARKVFDSDTEVRIREEDLAALLALAFQLGADQAMERLAQA